MSSGRKHDGEFREPRRKKVKPGTILRDPYPIIFWNKVGIPPCDDLWPAYSGVFDGESVIVDDPENMDDIYNLGYFGKKMLYRRDYESKVGDIPVIKERQWKMRVDWAAEVGYVLVSQDENEGNSSKSDSVEVSSPEIKSGNNNRKEESPAYTESGTQSTSRNNVDSKVCDHLKTKDDGDNCVNRVQQLIDNSAEDDCIILQKEEKKHNITKEEDIDKTGSENIVHETAVGSNTEEKSSVTDDKSEICPVSADSEKITKEIEKSEGCVGKESEIEGENASFSPLDEEKEFISEENEKITKEVDQSADREENESGIKEGRSKCNSPLDKEKKVVSMENEKATEEIDKLEVSIEKESEIKEVEIDSDSTLEKEKVGISVETLDGFKDGKSDSSSLSAQEKEELKSKEASSVENGQNIERKSKGETLEVPQGIGGCQNKNLDEEESNLKADEGKTNIENSEEISMLEENSDKSSKESKSIDRLEITHAHNENKEEDGEKTVETMDISEVESEVKVNEEKVDMQSKFGDENMKVEENLNESSILKEKRERLRTKDTESSEIDELDSSVQINDNSRQSSNDVITEVVSVKTDTEVKVNPELSSNECTTNDSVEQVALTSNVHSSIAKDAIVTSRENGPSKEIEASHDGNESSDIVELNDSAASIELIDDDRKYESTPKKTNSKEVKTKPQKRKFDNDDEDNDLSISEADIERKTPVEEEKDSQEEDENASKRRKTDEVVIVDEKSTNMVSKKSTESGNLDSQQTRKTKSCGNRRDGDVQRSSSKNKGLDESIEICEVVDVVDEKTPDNRKPSSFNAFSKRKASEDTPKCSDSDDDIMEVSVEEKLSEIKKRRKPAILRGNAKNSASSQSTEELLAQMRKNLPSDIEILALDDKGVSKKVSGSKKIIKHLDENEDDDVIEIDLKQSDMIESEDSADGQSNAQGNASYLNNFRRRLRKDHCNFKWMKMEDTQENDQNSDDDVIYEGIQEFQGNKSLRDQTKLENDYDVSPCIVLPDTDTEDENTEVQSLPRLESDPSVFLPSMDVLHLILEEAFFLAYGLGCLHVWDSRSPEIETDLHDDQISSSSAESECEGEHTNLAETDSGLKKDCINESSVDIIMESDKSDEESPVKKQQKSNVVSESKSHSSKNDAETKKECLEGPKTESSKSNISECSDSKDNANDSEKQVKESASDPSEDIAENSDTKNSEHEFSKGTHAEHKDSSGTKSKSNSNDKESISIDEEMSASVDESNSNKTSDHVPQDKKHVNLSVISCDDEANNKNSSKKNKKIETETSSEVKSNVDMKSSMEKVNDFAADPSITVIDLADSPPSRQWANKEGWSDSDDEDEVMDISPKNDTQNSRQAFNQSFNCVNEHPMSIREMWNAFRSSRASTSQCAIPFETTYAVYHHFRTKRWVVKPGLRFGGDFLLYKDGPPFYHASYLIVIDSSGYNEKSRFTWKTLGCWTRLAESVAKEVIICRVEWPESITEEDLGSPECLIGLTVQEILVKRWVSSKERQSEEVPKNGKADDFVPLES